MATQEFGKSRETTGFAQLSLTAPDFYSCLLSLISPSLSFQESNNSWVIVIAVLCDKVETQFPTEQEPKSSLSLSCSHCLSLTVLCETLHYSFLSHFPPTTSSLSHSLSPSYNILLLGKDFLDIIPKLHPSHCHTLCCCVRQNHQMILNSISAARKTEQRI